MDGIEWMDRLDRIGAWARSSARTPAPAGISEEDLIAAALELAGRRVDSAPAASSALQWWGRHSVIEGYLARLAELGALPMNGQGQQLRTMDVFDGPRTVATFTEPLHRPEGPWPQLVGATFRAGFAQVPTCTLIVAGPGTGPVDMGPDFATARRVARGVANSIRAHGGSTAEVMAAQMWLLQAWATLQPLAGMMDARDELAEFVRRANLRLDNAIADLDPDAVERATRMLEQSALALVEIEAAVTAFDAAPTGP